MSTQEEQVVALIGMNGRQQLRIQALEKALREAADYIAEGTAFSPPGSRGLDFVLKLERLLKGVERIDSHRDYMKCRTLDCALCHGIPANAGPR